MNLQQLQSAIRDLPGDLPLVFMTEEGPIGAGYHVTELKLAHVQSIDCGANTSRWKEVTLQLLDGSGPDHMAIETFQKITTQSVKRVAGLDLSPLRIEFAHQNKGVQIYEPALPEVIDGAVVVRLGPVHATCKPALKLASGKTAGGCCGTTQDDRSEAGRGLASQEPTTKADEAACCGGPAPAGVDACCVKDANAKADGKSGCGCRDSRAKTEANLPCCG